MSFEKLGALIQRKKWMALMAMGLMVAGCGGGSEGPAQKVEVVSGLRVQKIELQNVADELEVPGSVIAVSTAQVAARTMGTVIRVEAREGDNVKHGQVLARLDERELASRRNAAQAGAQGATAGVVQAEKAVVAAQAQADVMQKTYDRYAYLKEQKSVSPQEFDEVAAKYQGAQANLEQAKAGLRQAEAGASQAESESHAAQDVASYARIVAPLDGRVIRRTVEPGSMVSPGMTLFVVEDASRYQLETTLPAEALATIKKNAVARVQLDALGEKALTGKVAEIEAGADPASHTLKARINLPKEAGVQSGMFGRAFFSQGEKRVLMVPGDALVSRGQLHGLYVVGDRNLVHWRVVTLGKMIGNQVEVLSGLNDGELVVLNPGSQELDGMKTGEGVAGGEKHS
ncbi:MAG TPA: efflux RND transporter periplasmic adaptor subunit [Candidatus Sulfotelmatobacter sp.]|jgi:RND family efflux transporter MFP subunit|nr:efflux RND transporter periplasmic adaptor subunit [Candidatus Sulfotelmatobacter sp.]